MKTQNKKPITLTQFIKSSGIDPALIRAVVRQLGGREAFQEKAPDIANHGASGGYGGIIYYTETVAFSRKHKKLIVAYAEDLARDIGDGDAFQLIAGFNCLKELELSPGGIAALIYGNEPKDDDGSCDFTSVHNALCWFAAEEVSRAYSDFLENLEG
jgi:hypothetical protein